MIKRALKGIGLLLFLFLLYVAAQICYATMTDYQPEEIIALSPQNSSEEKITNDSIITLLTWNLGYGGLGAESDFFYSDGGILLSAGKMVRTPKVHVEKNVAGVLKTIAEHDVDIYLLQEVDFDSKRSYHINQFSEIEKILPNYSSIMATNYKVGNVPTPVLEPWNTYGTTFSGLGTFSKFEPQKSTRFQLPGTFSWPNKLYLLDRCAAQHRYPLQNGKELIVYNIHNSAYDRDGSIKKVQMEYLRKQWLAEYEQGNYLVIGGDWNQCPPHFQPQQFNPGMAKGGGNYNIAADFVPADWLWIYDPTVPTIRSTRSPYQANKTFISLIDFFLISPNVKALEVKGINLDFNYSDHQPVKIKVELLN